ncbi:hypothetical protein TWF132_004101 [Orbilia oligospora]|nr:hypothetical protein TWF132_004101 [Orbilia oligospora]
MSKRFSDASPTGLRPSAPAFVPENTSAKPSSPQPVSPNDQLHPFKQPSEQQSESEFGQQSEQQSDQESEQLSEQPYEPQPYERSSSDPPDRPVCGSPIRRTSSGPPDVYGLFSGPPPGLPPGFSPELSSSQLSDDISPSGPSSGLPPSWQSSELPSGQPSNDMPPPKPPIEPQKADSSSFGTQRQSPSSRIPYSGLPSIHNPSFAPASAPSYVPHHTPPSSHTPVSRTQSQPPYTRTPYYGPPSTHRPQFRQLAPLNTSIPSAHFQQTPEDDPDLPFTPVTPVHQTIPLQPAVQPITNAPPGLTPGILSPPLASPSASFHPTNTQNITTVHTTNSTVSTPGNERSAGSVSNPMEVSSQQSEAERSTNSPTTSAQAPFVPDNVGYTPHFWICQPSQVANLVDIICNVPARVPKLPSICLGVKGYKLSRYGTVALITIYLSARGITYVIDIHTLGVEAFITPGSTFRDTTLKKILEDPEICLIMFDCRNANDALFNKFDVYLHGVIDLQLLELALTQQRNRIYLKSLDTAIDQSRVLSPAQMDRWKRFREIGETLLTPSDGICAFHDRPVRPDILEYCVQDVVHLTGVYWNLFRQLYSSKNHSVWQQRIEKETNNRLALARDPCYDGLKTQDWMHMAPSSWAVYND